MLSSGNSVVSGLTVKSLIHFEFDFYIGCEVAVWFDHFPWSHPVSPTSVLKDVF